LFQSSNALIIFFLFAVFLSAGFFILYFPSSSEQGPHVLPIGFEEERTLFGEEVSSKSELPWLSGEKPISGEAREEEEFTNLLEEVSRLRKSLQTLGQAQATSSPSFLLPPPAAPRIKSEEIYAKATRALVNIFCKDSEEQVYILGSGAVIDPQGYVLTNGHLAENFEKENVFCTLRRGSPASPFAKAKLAYLPDQNPLIGTTKIAQKDFALLKITEAVGSNPLPETFDYFEFDPTYAVKPQEVLYSLGFPTEFLGAATIAQNTNILFTLGTIDRLVSADDDLSDAEGAYLGGEISAQHGSSGGIFLEIQSSKIVGLFVGLTEGETTAERKQFMFLISYIDDIVRQERGFGLKEFLYSHP